MKARHLIPLVTLLTSSFLLTMAQAPDERASRPRYALPERPSGLLTSRILTRDLPKWQAIEQIIRAENASGQPLHPVLYSLYEWAWKSGHAIYLELILNPPAASGTAGNFSLLRFDPTGNHHEALIKLYLSNIDRALISKTSVRADGLIPFNGMKKEERYAEVLGHELAHARDILANLETARKVEELIEETNELLLAHHAERRGESLSSELKRRLQKRDSLLKTLEKHAEEIERLVWEELTAGRSLRGKTTENLIVAR